MIRMATAVSTLDEEELILNARQGDRDAYGELVRAHAGGILNVVHRLCGDPQLAEDAAQETFLQAWLHLNSYRPHTSLRNWLYRIAVNAAKDMLRKEKRLVPEAVEDLWLADSRPSPEAEVAKREREASVRNAVVALPEACRAVLVLREYEGLSYQEISSALDIPVGTVMSRLNYARGLLKEKLKAQLLEAENV